eukprot:1363111-Amorphochlora_amoeboformis.AAC.1
MEDAGDAAIKLRLVSTTVCHSLKLSALYPPRYSINAIKTATWYSTKRSSYLASQISSCLPSASIPQEWLIPYVEYMYKNAPYFITPEERGWLKQVLEYLKKHFVKSLYPAVQLAAKETKEFKDWFDMVDTNNDGHIDAREFSRGTVLLLFKVTSSINGQDSAEGRKECDARG